MSQSIIKCEIHPDHVEIEYTSRAGVKKEKLVNVHDFIKILASTVKVENFSYVLTPGTRFVAKKGSDVFIGVEFPPMVRPMKHSTEGTATTPLPGGIFIINARETPAGYTYNQMFLFATKEIITTADSQLYDWPGANVSTDGSVCIGSGGSAAMKNMKTYKQIGDLSFLFFAYSANNDMSTNRFTPYKGVDRPQALYKQLEREGATEFPLSILRPIKTIGEFMNQKELSFNV